MHAKGHSLEETSVVDHMDAFGVFKIIKVLGVVVKDFSDVVEALFCFGVVEVKDPRFDMVQTERTEEGFCISLQIRLNYFYLVFETTLGILLGTRSENRSKSLCFSKFGRTLDK